ncbi:MAG: hypothetical protein ABW133_16385 [Polyangiaceae bacterium]
MRRIDGALRVGAALVGTLPVALLAGLLVARLLPASEETRFAIGHAVVIPFWIGGMCLASLARSGTRAWIMCMSIVALLSFVTR